MNVTSNTSNRPRRFFGYRSCIQCAYQFYPEQETQMMCRLCQVELTHRSGKSNTDFHAPVPAPVLQVCALPWCDERFTPRDPRHKYCSPECGTHAHNSRRRP